MGVDEAVRKAIETVQLLKLLNLAVLSDPVELVNSQIRLRIDV